MVSYYPLNLEKRLDMQFCEKFYYINNELITGTLLETDFPSGKKNRIIAEKKIITAQELFGEKDSEVDPDDDFVAVDYIFRLQVLENGVLKHERDIYRCSLDFAPKVLTRKLYLMMDRMVNDEDAISHTIMDYHEAPKVLKLVR